MFAFRAVMIAALAGQVVCGQTFQSPKKWIFSTHITPILTYSGCNQTACHGSPVGKNGFKLSLFGYEPEKDFEVLLKRLNTKDPEASMILRKPTMQVPHGGGPRFKQDSTQFQIL